MLLTPNGRFELNTKVSRFGNTPPRVVGRDADTKIDLYQFHKL